MKDAWGFAEEVRLGRPAVVGLIRVPVSKVAQALTSSGTKGVFVEPASRDDVVKCEVAWLEPLEGETWTQAVDRAKELKPQYGVFLGKRQVGMRRPASRIRYLALKNTPASWSDDLVRDLVEEQTSLKQVGVYRKHTAKGSATWYFKARAEEDAGCFLKVEDGADTATLWVTPVQGEVVRHTRPIHEKGGFVFQRPAPRGADKPEAKAKPEEDKADEPPTKKPAVARAQRAVLRRQGGWRRQLLLHCGGPWLGAAAWRAGDAASAHQSRGGGAHAQVQIVVRILLGRQRHGWRQARGLRGLPAAHVRKWQMGWKLGSLRGGEDVQGRGLRRPGSFGYGGGGLQLLGQDAAGPLVQ